MSLILKACLYEEVVAAESFSINVVRSLFLLLLSQKGC